MTMKNRFSFRTLSLVLAVLLLMSLSCSAFAEVVTVRIPSKIGNLDLPEMPEPLELYTWTDSIPTYGNPKDPSKPKTPNNPCPILAVSDAIMHLQFSEQPDFAVASWYNGKENINVGADGYAELSTEGKKIQAGFTWGGDKAREKPWFITAGKDGISAGYSNSGDVKFIEYTFDGDFFDTGIEGAQTTIRYEPVTIDGDHYIYTTEPDPKTGKEKTVKVNLKGKEYEKNKDGSYKLDEKGNKILVHWYYTNWYIPTITTVYPAGSGLTKIVAEYWNTEKAPLNKFAVSYSPKGTYTSSYRMTVTSTAYSSMKPYARTIPVNDSLTIRVSGF